jgi:hypothetical protein
VSELGKWAGFDGRERPMGIGTGRPHSKLTLAHMATRATLNRYQRMREMARLNPPTPATGGFPYYRKGQPCGR